MHKQSSKWVPKGIFDTQELWDLKRKIITESDLLYWGTRWKFAYYQNKLMPPVTEEKKENLSIKHEKPSEVHQDQNYQKIMNDKRAFEIELHKKSQRINLDILNSEKIRGFDQWFEECDKRSK